MTLIKRGLQSVGNRPTPMQLRVIGLLNLGLKYGEINAILKKKTAAEQRMYRMRKRLGLVAPTRFRPRVSQLSACGRDYN